MEKVSIIVPCYNQAQYLDECLQSVFSQTYENWECIIVNDGSPDDTENVAKEWINRDTRFKYLFKKNGGLSSARNAGIATSEGEFILPLDADDKIGQEYLKLALKTFEEDASLKVVYSKAEKFGEENGEWNLVDFSLEALARNNMIFCSAFFKKKDWKLVGGYDVRMVHGLEDWEFWIALLKDGGAIKKIDYTGFYYRTKPESMIKSLNTSKRNKLTEYMSIKHADFFVNQHGNTIQLYREYVELKKFHSKVVSSFLYKMYKFPFFLYRRINKFLK